MCYPSGEKDPPGPRPRRRLRRYHEIMAKPEEKGQPVPAATAAILDDFLHLRQRKTERPRFRRGTWSSTIAGRGDSGGNKPCRVQAVSFVVDAVTRKCGENMIPRAMQRCFRPILVGVSLLTFAETSLRRSGRATSHRSNSTCGLAHFRRRPSNGSYAARAGRLDPELGYVLGNYLPTDGLDPAQPFRRSRPMERGRRSCTPARSAASTPTATVSPSVTRSATARRGR